MEAPLSRCTVHSTDNTNESKKTKKGKKNFNPPSGVIMPFSYHSNELDNIFFYSGSVGLYVTYTVITLEPEVSTK